jgi:hypothetical protein
MNRYEKRHVGRWQGLGLFLIPGVEVNNDEFYRDTECKTTWTAKIPADNSLMHTALETTQTCEDGNGMTHCQHNTAKSAHRKSGFGQIKTVLRKRRSVDFEGLFEGCQTFLTISVLFRFIMPSKAEFRDWPGSLEIVKSP